MEEQDNIPQMNAWEEVTPMVNPYEVEVASDTNARKLLAADAIAASLAEGRDPNEAYAEVMSSDVASYRDNLVSEAADAEFSALNEAVELMAVQDPAALTNEPLAVVDAYKDVEVEVSADNKLAPYIAYVRKFPSSDNVSDDEIKDVAARKYMLAQIASLMDEDYGWGDKGVDLLGMMAWPDMSYNVASTIGEMSEDTGAVEDYLSTGDLIIKFSKSLGKLDPDTRIKVFDELLTKVVGVEDNKLKQATLLMAAIGETPEGDIAFDANMDKLDQLGIGYALGSGVLKTIKGMNALRELAKLAKSETEAATIADIASRSEEAASAMGIPRLDAAAAGDPNTDAIAFILDGSPTNISTAVRNQWSMIDERVAEATNIVDEGLGLTEAERIQAAEKRASTVSKLDGVSDVTAVPLEDGISLKFNVVDPDTLLPRAVDVTVPYRVDDVTGTFIEKGVTFLGEFGKGVLNSPNYLQGADRGSLVAAFERTLFASSKIKRELNDAFNTINKGLSKDEAVNVSKILTKGDDADRVFSYKELVQDGVGGIKLSEKEFTAYAATRKLMDELWRVKNTETRRKLTAKGIQEVVVGDQIVTAKPYATLQSASAAYTGATFRTVSIPNPIRGGATFVDNLTPDDLKDYYDNGYILSRTSESGNFVRAGDTNAEWALVRRSDVRDLPIEVLNKKVGYIPRVYEDAHFFVKQNRRVNVDGKDVIVGERTLRYFDNAEDAEIYLDGIEKAAKDSGKAFDRAEYKVLGNREMQAADLDDEFIGMYGGLYSGARAQEAIKFGLDGVEGKRVDALEAIQNYINHVGNRYPLAEYRLGIERRWMNHAKANGALPRDYVGSFREAVGVVENSAASPLVKTKLMNAHAQIEYMNKVPSIGEQQWAGTIRALGKSLERLPGVGKGMAKYLYRLDHTSPVDAVRGATFNLMLGMYNWAQFFVQGSGAAVALSIRPLDAPRAMSNMIAFGLLDNIQDAGARAATIQKIEKISGFDGIGEEYALWKKSGMFDSVVNTNADVASIYKGLPYDASIVRKVWTNGTLPYKMGELANMRISFGTALSEWRRANKGKKLDDKALKYVVQRAENFRLSMSRANTSTWQRGWMAIPTQFQQINARFFEALLGTQFSRGDKLSFLLGQMAMFGAAGVPFLDQAYGFINNHIGRDVNSLTEEEIIWERRGLIGLLFNHYLDVDADITGRVAIAGGVVDQLISFSTEPGELTDVLLGPSASTKDNIVALFDNLVMTGKVAFTMDDLTPKDGLMMLQANLTALAQLPASTRNLLLAHDMYGDSPVYRTRDGKARFDVDSNVQTMVSQAVGFQQVSKSDYWELVMGKKREAERLKGNVDRIAIMYLNMVRFAEDDAEMSRAYKLSIDAALQSYKDEQDRIRVMHAVRERLKRENDPVGKQVLEILKTHTSKFSDKGAVYNPLVAKELDEARGTE